MYLQKDVSNRGQKKGTLNERISELRDLLNRMTNFNNLDDFNVIMLSKELDSLILEYYSK
ncbi:MAG: aspartyl-phosphate phosphatase Spo0E family protein [Bacillota bacterium]|nr:aspartyl-phosphate phosphatase Spo0E family protein [Bacillota bacterium]